MTGLFLVPEVNAMATDCPAPPHLAMNRLRMILPLLLWSALMAQSVPAVSPANVSATNSCCNVLELRQYTLHPGRREAFIELFDTTFADPLEATGMTVIGQFRDLDRPDRFVWLRGFQDMPARAGELATFYDSELWHAHRNEANASIDDSDNVLLLEPVSPARRLASPPPRAGLKDSPTAGGLVVVTLYYTKAESLSTFTTLFDHTLRPALDAAGARTLGLYVTSMQTNNFPRLPVRTGEHIVVWVAAFAGPDAYAAYQVDLSSGEKWARNLWPAAREQLSREPEVLRLTPTARSRLRG
jgi:NIPSNAP